ncbi:MAG: nucleotidyltransferase domain-containing protein [Clostridiales bacterium]|nr:nucleotidyltransferase domain-containing protein [Clostridiales bacterium]
MNQYGTISKDDLVERAKELECLYLIEESLTKDSLTESLGKIPSIIPMGFRNPDSCKAVIEFDKQLFNPDGKIEDGDELESAIIVNNQNRGYIKVMYPKNTFMTGEIAFLEHEVRLLNTIARRFSETIDKKDSVQKYNYRNRWEAILDLLQKTDHEILLYVCEKMLALLASINPNMVKNIFNEMGWVKYNLNSEVNFPLETLPAVDVIRFSKILFGNSLINLDDLQIYDYINLWIYQGKTYELIKIVDKKDSDVKKISHALSAYLKAVKNNEMTSEATKRWLKVELTRRFITGNPKLISRIHNHVHIEAFHKLLDSFISSPRSIGRIGGKGSGFFLANQILESHKDEFPEFENIVIPKTWYISSDEFGYLLEDNGFDELNEHKYLDMIDIRTSYPRVIQMLKNARLSPYILNELNKIVDCCEDCPLIIRSSSLLEDQMDTSFSGKYKSLFITNTGTRAERIKQLVDGILEVYASIFNPDSIQYRIKNDLLDCNEQMGIMIQEVVGTKVGPYYFPLFAGVAFSNNELRWSPRIKREDGLLRMVMGLGTRAVDRVGEDYPLLLSPGQANLRVNQSPMEISKYSPQYMDLIDLDNNQFLTLPIQQVIKEYGDYIPNINLVASVLNNDIIMDSNPFTTDFKNDNIIITLDGLVKKTSFVKQAKSILALLQKKLGYPVDIEFASDGKHFYLLQCRPQSQNYDNAPVAIPNNIPYQSTIFTANKYISNGKVTGIKTVVYVDPMEYSKLESHKDLLNIRDIIHELNRILPRKSFILLGPGRWGSRGDIKLGVPVAYSDINNTAMLIEVASKQSRFEPELSFGTHFFQDLVEENIKYLPLYPEDRESVFNRSFFNSSKNSLSKILPMYSYLDEVVKVITIEETFFNKELIVLMNGDLQKAIAYLEEPSHINSGPNSHDITLPKNSEHNDEGWKWRHYMAEQIANQIDMEAFCVKGIYLFGSTNNCTARLNSDIDLLIHFDGTVETKEKLNDWLLGWSLALSEMNYIKTGYKSDGLLDIHYITDQDIIDKTSYAIKINSIFDPAYPLRLRTQ